MRFCFRDRSVALYRRHYVANSSCWSYMLYTTHVVQFHSDGPRLGGNWLLVLLILLDRAFPFLPPDLLTCDPNTRKSCQRNQRNSPFAVVPGHRAQPIPSLCSYALRAVPGESISDVSTYALWLHLFISWRLPELKIMIRRTAGCWCRKDEPLVIGIIEGEVIEIAIDRDLKINMQQTTAFLPFHHRSTIQIASPLRTHLSPQPLHPAFDQVV